MKLLGAIALFASACCGQIFTSTAVMNPVFGTRTYPFPVEQAAVLAAVEAEGRCGLPNAIPECWLLKQVNHFGVAVSVVSNDPLVSAFKVIVKYTAVDGQEREATGYVDNSGNGGIAYLWIGKSSNVKAVAIPLKAAGVIQ